MKTGPSKKVLTLGEFVMSVYDTCDEHKARAIVWLAVCAGLVVSQGQGRPAMVQMS